MDHRCAIADFLIAVIRPSPAAINYVHIIRSITGLLLQYFFTFFFKGNFCCCWFGIAELSPVYLYVTVKHAYIGGNFYCNYSQNFGFIRSKFSILIVKLGWIFHVFFVFFFIFHVKIGKWQMLNELRLKT